MIVNSGNSMYVSEEKYIRLIDVATAAVSKFVGTGSLGSDDGTGAAASVYFPNGLTWAFAADTFVFGQDGGDSVIRMVTTPGAVVTTIAGSGTSGYANGVGTAAKFSNRIFKNLRAHDVVTQSHTANSLKL